MERFDVKCIVVQMTILRMEHLGKVHTQLFRPKHFFICMRETSKPLSIYNKEMAEFLSVLSGLSDRAKPLLRSLVCGVQARSSRLRHRIKVVSSSNQAGTLTN